MCLPRSVHELERITALFFPQSDRSTQKYPGTLVHKSTWYTKVYQVSGLGWAAASGRQRLPHPSGEPKPGFKRRLGTASAHGVGGWGGGFGERVRAPTRGHAGNPRVQERRAPIYSTTLQCPEIEKENREGTQRSRESRISASRRLLQGLRSGCWACCVILHRRGLCCSSRFHRVRLSA